MKPVLLLIAVYTLIYQQYRKRTHHQIHTEVVSTPLPQPIPSPLSEGDSVFLESSGTHKSLTTAAFVQVLPVQ